MVIVSGNWRCFTTWVSTWLAQHGDWPFVMEPCHIDTAVFRNCADMGWRRLVEANAHLLHRYPGHNEEPDAEACEIIRALLDGMPDAYGGARLAKVIQLPYWRLMREVWPDCRIVFMRRRLRSWLAAAARAHVVRNIILEETLWAPDPPWVPLAKTIARREGDCSRLAIYTLGCYHLVRQQYNLKTLREELGNEWLCVEGEQLTSQYELEMPRLLDYCGAPPPNPDDLYTEAMPPGRTWNGQPWGWRDCCEVEAAINLHRDLVREAVA